MKTKTRKKNSFQKLRHKTGLTLDAARELCGVSERTARRWDDQGAPLMAMRLLHLYDRKDVSHVGPGWEGFMFSRGRLIHGKERLIFTPDGLLRQKTILRNLEQAEQTARRIDNLCPVMRLARKAGQGWQWAKPLAGWLESIAQGGKRLHERRRPPAKQ